MKESHKTQPNGQFASRGAEARAVPASGEAIGPDWRYMLGGVCLSLIWIALPVAAFVASNPSALQATFVALAVLVFVGLHIGVMLQAIPHPTIAIVGMVAIASALVLFNSTDWTALFVFAAVAAGYRLPWRRSLLLVAACGPLAAAATIRSGGAVAVAVSMAIAAPAVGFTLLSLARLLRMNRELRAAREQLAAVAVAEERLRFARDLHDLLGHSLSVIALKAELAGRLLTTDGKKAQVNIEDIQTVARSALGEVRQAVGGYREPRLEAELAGARFALSSAGIKSTVVHDAAELPPEVEAVLAWAVREGSNMIRHSGAHNCRIAIECGSDEASAEISDDGRGGTPDATGHGIAGLRERIERLGGHIDAGPAEHGGFRLRAHVPLPTPGGGQ